MTLPFFELTNSPETTIEIKKSLFISRAYHVNSREEALDIVAKLKKEIPDARHHCWAYLLGSPMNPDSVAMSDDGEPSGTAGKPILNVMQHNDVGNILIVVIRYFGGIKLGAGGLVRAYSQAATRIYDQMSRRENIPMSERKVEADFKDEQYVRHLVNQYKGLISDHSYDKSVLLKISIPTKSVKEFESSLTSLSNIVLREL